MVTCETERFVVSIGAARRVHETPWIIHSVQSCIYKHQNSVPTRTEAPKARRDGHTTQAQPLLK